MNDFQDQAKNWLRNVVKQNPDKIKAGVEKAGDLIDKQTGGKYAEKVDSVQEKVGSYVDSHAEQHADGPGTTSTEQSSEDSTTADPATADEGTAEPADSGPDQSAGPRTADAEGTADEAAPDTVDVGYSFGDANKALYQPYKVATFDSISQKDPDGAWVGDYYGVLSFEINKDVIKGDSPKDWKDLLDPKYAHSVALAGDPLNSNQAIQSVEAAALANGGSLDNSQAGLDFFKQLNANGNFVPTIAKQGTLVSGETPIVITWSYLALADRDSLKGTVNVEVVIPATGKFGGIYVQAISKTAPHPNAAKLWEEYLYSDEGQLVWTNAYCYTTRYDDLVKKGAISGDLKAKLPDVTGTVFPTNPQLTAAKTLITGQWASVTGLGPLKTQPPTP